MGGNFTWIILGCALIGAGASAVGVFAFLRKQSLVGDAIAHSLLPGVALAFILGGQKNIWFLLPGAFLAGWLGMISIEGITKYSKVKPDAAIAIVLTTFFAGGVVLLTYIQQGSFGNQTGLDDFLFGKAAAMVPSDLLLFAIVDLILISVVVLIYPYLKLFSFDPEFARATGLPVRAIRLSISSITVLAIASGIQAVGVVLMAALIITPAAAAGLFTARLSRMILIAVMIGMIAAVSGVYISSLSSNMPTGPWIVFVLSVIAVAAFLFAPKKGLIHRRLRRLKHQEKVRTENLLKLFYRLKEKKSKEGFSARELLSSKRFEGKELESLLAKLEKADYLSRRGEEYRMTRKGEMAGARVVRVHRLWELYLNERMNIAPDHVHPDAEAIEHIITPELERELLKDLGYPERDPHRSLIPGVKKPSP
jgi:manganese/zinc/iron transport system permease protein